MVTTYQLLCRLIKDDMFSHYVKAGIIPVEFIDYKLIYEFYTKEKSREIRHSEAITFTGEEFNKSDNWIWKIKYKMESIVK